MLPGVAEVEDEGDPPGNCQEYPLMPPLSIGYVSLIGVLLMAPIAAYVAPLGARLAHSLPKRRLEIAFGLFLLAVAVRFVVSLL